MGHIIHHRRQIGPCGLFMLFFWPKRGKKWLKNLSEDYLRLFFIFMPAYNELSLFFSSNSLFRGSKPWVISKHAYGNAQNMATSVIFYCDENFYLFI